jgi:protoheme IX farnesyltransferase
MFSPLIDPEGIFLLLPPGLPPPEQSGNRPENASEVERMKTFLPLLRPHLSAMVAASALAGYALHPAPHAAGVAALLLAGVGFLAAGCSALNQVQERDVDARMERTRCRPVASGRLSVRAGLAIALLLAAGGVGLLAAVGWTTAGLGAFALLWYNGVYTPLKRLTAFAVLPGALCGALPPLIGWAAAGGPLADYRIVLLAGIICLWQIPHFWFFTLKHREDFLRGGLPTIFSRFTPTQIYRLALVWVFSLACATLLLPAFGVLQHPAALLLCWLVAAALAAGAGSRLLTGQSETLCSLPFGQINLALLCIISSLLVEGFC